MELLLQRKRGFALLFPQSLQSFLDNLLRHEAQFCLGLPNPQTAQQLLPVIVVYRLIGFEFPFYLAFEGFQLFVRFGSEQLVDIGRDGRSAAIS